MPPKTKVMSEKIVSKALEITREQGIHCVTASAIARGLKCSTQPIFWAFETMENLREALIVEANKVYNSYIQTVNEGMSKFKSIGINYLTFAKNEPKLFKLLFMSNRQDGARAQDFLNLDDNREYILSAIAERTGLSGTRAKELYVNMWIFAHGIATMIVSKTAQFTYEEIGEMLTDTCNGLIKVYKSK